MNRNRDLTYFRCQFRKSGVLRILRIFRCTKRIQNINLLFHRISILNFDCTFQMTYSINFRSCMTIIKTRLKCINTLILFRNLYKSIRRFMINFSILRFLPIRFINQLKRSNTLRNISILLPLGPNFLLINQLLKQPYPTFNRPSLQSIRFHILSPTMIISRWSMKLITTYPCFCGCSWRFI